MGFRSEIHGLRAVAIALVVLHHVWFGRISGGIDAFLLIGAFLLTATFLRRHDRGEPPAAARVLSGRLVRLIPPAAATIAVVVVITPLVLPGTLWPTVWSQAVASLLFGTNVQLIAGAVDYYAGASGLASPLQHFWSLSIQGQVIIGLCIVLGLLTRIRNRQLMRGLLAGLLLIVLVCSFSYGVWLTAVHPTVAYFDSFARLWEFAAGALLALGIDRFSLTGRRAAVVGTGGLVVLLTAAFVLPADVRYPGVAALVPVLATTAVILGGGGAQWSRRCLQSRPLTWLAERSYGLFLWHWPLLICWLAISRQPGAGVLDGAAVILISLVLADLSYRLIEQRLKGWRPRLIPLRGWVRDGSVVAATFALVVGMVFSMQRWEEAQAANARQQSAEANPGARVLQPDYDHRTLVSGRLLPLPNRLDEEWAPDIENCPGFDFSEGVIARCKLYQPELPAGGEPRATVAVVGSSHAAQWVGALLPLATEHGWQLLQLEMADCEFRGELDADEVSDGCRGFNHDAEELILEIEADAVLTVATRSAWEGPGEIVVPGYREAVQPFTQAGMTVVAVRDNPRWQENPAECLERHPDRPELCAQPQNAMLADPSPLVEVADIPGVEPMDLTPLLCPNRICHSAIGNVGVYLDRHHISRTYLQTAVPQFEAEWRRATGWVESD